MGGFDLQRSVPALTVFFQGLLSFFSPCVLPLLPLYIGYLSGGTVSRDADGNPIYNQKKVMLHTLFFALGISFAFFVLGMGVTAIGAFFNSHKMVFARIGGVVIFLFGLYQLGVLGDSKVLGQERRLPFHIEKWTMSPLTAFVMGFTFSFAWTPCVGPALASVLLMTASASSQAAGFLLIGLYALGFLLPFLLVGLFTTKLLTFFKKRRSVLRYTVKIGAVLMLIMGVMMFTGQMNGFTGYLSKAGGTAEAAAAGAEAAGTERQPDGADAAKEGNTASASSSGDAAADTGNERAAAREEGQSARKTVPALDFTLQDQNGETHSLADYKGKVIFLNFWATWCPPCRREMPDIQALYEKYTKEEDAEVVVLGVAGPNYGQEGSAEDIADFLAENGYSYPVLMDTDQSLFTGYGISAFPTTFMIDRDGHVYGYVTGALTGDIMQSIVDQTLAADSAQS